MVNVKPRTYSDFHSLWFARVAKNADVEQSELRFTKGGALLAADAAPVVAEGIVGLELASVIQGTTTAKAEALEHSAQRKAESGHFLVQKRAIEGERRVIGYRKRCC